MSCCCCSGILLWIVDNTWFIIECDLPLLLILDDIALIFRGRRRSRSFVAVDEYILDNRPELLEILSFLLGDVKLGLRETFICIIDSLFKSVFLGELDDFDYLMFIEFLEASLSESVYAVKLL